jgi:predicted transcriptional regulator
MSRRINIRLSDDLWDALDDASKNSRISKTDIIADAIEEHLDQEKYDPPKPRVRRSRQPVDQ